MNGDDNTIPQDDTELFEEPIEGQEEPYPGYNQGLPPPGYHQQQQFQGGMGTDYPQDSGVSISDNEYINLLRDVTDPNLRKQLDHYLRYNPLTPAATHKLKVYYRGVLNMGLVGSNIRNQNDFERLMDRYLITKCELPLGLTCYDVNETFTHVINIIDLNFFNQELRAIGGFLLKRLATQTSESVSHENSGMGQQMQQQQEQSTLNKLTSFLR
jgi:hypothetical protein